MATTVESIQDLQRFKLDRFLSEDHISHTIALLGSLNDGTSSNIAVPAILRIQRPQLDISSPSSFSTMMQGIEKVQIEHNTDIYTWMRAWLGADRVADAKIYVIAPATEIHIRKYTTQRLTMVRETPELYETLVEPYINSLPLSRIQWVHDILSGKSEASSILHDTDKFVVLPDMKWIPPPAAVKGPDSPDLSGLYLVAIARDASIRSLRDLRKCHIPMLRDIQRSAVKVCRERWGMLAGALRCYVHYQPSYYQFHVHIVNANQAGYMGMAVGQAHLLDDIISLLDLEDSSSEEPGIYQRITLTYGLGDQHGLFAAMIGAQDAEALDAAK